MSFKDTVKKSKVYEKAMVLLIGLYYLYRKSPKLKNGLKESFLALKQKQVLPTRVGGTRWLPHLDKAVDAFFKGYQAIRHHLESASHTSPKAEGLAKIAADGNVITFLLCLKVVLYSLVTLSKTLQRENLTLANANSQMSATRTVLSQLKEEKHTSIQEVLESAQYKGEKLKFAGHKTGIVVPTIAGELIDNITSRFPDNVDVAVAATYIINFKNWPNCATHLKDFGTDAFRAVVEQFRSVLEDTDCDSDRIVSKWQLLKALIIEKFPKEFTDTPEGQLSWTSVYKAVSDSGFDDILKVIELLPSLPFTSVRNECGFSIMKLAKTKRRGRLNINSLNNLMVVNQLGQSIAEFDPRPAIENFMVTPSGRQRRVQGYKRKSSAPEADYIHIDEEDEVQHAELDINEDGLLAECYNSDDEEESDEDDEIDEDHVNKLICLYSSD